MADSESFKLKSRILGSGNEPRIISAEIAVPLEYFLE